MNHAEPERYTQFDSFFGESPEGQSNKVMNNRQPRFAAAANEACGLSKRITEFNKWYFLSIDAATIKTGKGRLQAISSLR